MEPQGQMSQNSLIFHGFSTLKPIPPHVASPIDHDRLPAGTAHNQIQFGTKIMGLGPFSVELQGQMSQNSLIFHGFSTLTSIPAHVASPMQ